MKEHVFHPEARLELAEAGYYYMGKSMLVAQRFYGEMDALLAEVCERPGLRRVFDAPARRHLSWRADKSARPKR